MPILLCVHTANGREYVSVVYGDRHREPILGEFNYIEITDAQAAMSLEMLKTWYDEDRQKTRAERRAEADKATRIARLLERLVRIIQETKHDGERENAKDLYLKVTGKPYTQKPA